MDLYSYKTEKRERAIYNKTYYYLSVPGPSLHIYSYKDHKFRTKIMINWLER